MAENKEKNFVSAVVYTHNVQNEIQYFLSVLTCVLREHFEKFEIICVNDASSDHTVEKIREYAKNEKENVISILNMSFYQGMELSMNAGVDLAIGDFVFEFDSAYLIYSEKIIFDVYQKCLMGYDIVAASPKNKKRFASQTFYKLYNKVADTQYPLKTESFRVLSRRAINRVHSMSKTIPYRKAVYANCGLKTDAVYFDEVGETPRVSRETQKNQEEIAIDSLILYSNVAYKCSIKLTQLMMIVTVAIGGYAAFIYIMRKPVAGWTTTMSFLAVSFLGIFAVLTIMIKYMSIILRISFNRQKYVVESIDKLSN